MTPKQMREAQALLDYRKSTRQLIAEMDKISVYALELRVPALGGRVFVFSNDQPGAQRELTPGLNASICAAALAGLADDVDGLTAKLTAMGVDVEAADAEDADQGEG
jgi:hypothetical protein